MTCNHSEHLARLDRHLEDVKARMARCELQLSQLGQFREAVAARIPGDAAAAGVPVRDGVVVRVQFPQAAS